MYNAPIPNTLDKKRVYNSSLLIGSDSINTTPTNEMNINSDNLSIANKE